MATREKIFEHWKDDPRINGWSSNCCMACGQNWEEDEIDGETVYYGFEIQRAHIIPHQFSCEKDSCRGCCLDVENLHNLCSICHRDSEGLSGWLYWLWLERRTHTDTIFSYYNNTKINFGGVHRWAGNRLYPWLLLDGPKEIRNEKEILQ
jgi:hypothetical protein